MTNGVARKLSQSTIDEIEEQKKLKNQYHTHKTIKTLREEIDNQRKQLSECLEEEKKKIIETKLGVLTAEYKNVRYKDHRNYPGKLKMWKTAYPNYLRNTTNSNNSEKVARAASDLIIKYCETVAEYDLNLDFLINGRTLNEILLFFYTERRFGNGHKDKILVLF